MAVHEVHVVKATAEKFEEYKKIFAGSGIQRHYGNAVYDWMQAGLTAGEVYIAEDRNGEAVGFMWMQLESAYAGLPYLALLGARDDYRYHGIGRMLLKYFIDTYEAKGANRGLIAVNDWNPRARALYESFGFHKITTYPESVNPANNIYLLMRKSRTFNSNV